MISIETSIVKGLLFDQEYASKVVPHLKDEFFDGHHKELYKIYSKLYDKYGTTPTIEAMVISLKQSGLSENIYESALGEIELVIKNRSERPDTTWLIDETQRYCSDKALFNALYQSISIIEGNDKSLDKHCIPNILEDALAISFDQNIGSDYLEDFQKRFDYYTSTTNKLPFPLAALNTLSNGGLPPKTLCAILAGTNVGKSAMMCYLAGEWLRAGHDVLYITMEMSEEAVQERVDANLLDMTTDELKNPSLNKEMFLSKVQQLRSRTTGRLIVKEYPTSSAHAGHFRYLLKELKQKKKFKPRIIFIDYINICASSRYKAGAGANSYTIIKSIAEELRGLAVEEEVTIFTATQTNREGMKDNKPDMTSTSESVGLPQSLDWFVAMVTNEELMELGQQLILPLKTRFGNKAGLKSQLVRIDFDKMRYTDVVNDSAADMQSTLGKHVPSTTKPKVSGIPTDIDWD
jgi:replicative DNA helicase